MPGALWPNVWALVSTLLGVFGVAYVPSDAVKSVVAAAAALVLAVWQWQHHKTVRHADALAADLGRRKAESLQAVASAAGRLPSVAGVVQAAAARGATDPLAAPGAEAVPGSPGPGLGSPA